MSQCKVCKKAQGQPFLDQLKREFLNFDLNNRLAGKQQFGKYSFTIKFFPRNLCSFILRVRKDDSSNNNNKRDHRDLTCRNLCSPLIVARAAALACATQKLLSLQEWRQGNIPVFQQTSVYGHISVEIRAIQHHPIGAPKDCSSKDFRNSNRQTNH